MRLMVCVRVWVGVCALPFIVCARCFESASTLCRVFSFFLLCSNLFFFVLHIIILCFYTVKLHLYRLTVHTVAPTHVPSVHSVVNTYLTFE